MRRRMGPEAKRGREGVAARTHNPSNWNRVPSYWGIGLTHATGRGQFAPQAAAPHSYKLATVVRAPSGPRISVVAIIAFNYGANYDPAVPRVTVICLLMNSPHAKVTT